MCQDRQERPEYSSFHTLTPSSLGPEGGNYRFILTTPTIRRVNLPRNRFSHAWLGSSFGAQKRHPQWVPYAQGPQLRPGSTGIPTTAHPLYLLASRRLPQGLLLYLATSYYSKTRYYMPMTVSLAAGLADRENAKIIWRIIRFTISIH